MLAALQGLGPPDYNLKPLKTELFIHVSAAQEEALQPGAPPGKKKMQERGWSSGF